MKKPMIYVAGPISTGGDIPGNTHRGVKVAEELRREGFITFCPHLSVYTETVCGPATWESWLEYDEEIILRCDAVFRMEGASKGADREEAFAQDRGIPVFKSVEAMRAWRDIWVAKTPEARILGFLQNEIGRWGDKTFGQSTPSSVLAHFKKEAKELIDGNGDPEEAADCVLLILHLAHKKAFSLWEQIRKKFEINKNRVWGKPDKDGVVEHVR